MTDSSSENKPARKPRGFAAMSPELVREIAKKGGKAAHAAGTAHEFTSEEARVAGRKGGIAAHRARGRAVRDSAPIFPVGNSRVVLDGVFELAPGEAILEHPEDT